MTEEPDQRFELTRLLGDLLDFYHVIDDHVDITDVGMKVDHEASVDELLCTYLCLYGETDNRHGGFNTAEKFKEVFDRCKCFGDIPEVCSMMFRLEIARINLEEALDGVDVTKFGYERKDDGGKLLLYKDDLKQITF